MYRNNGLVDYRRKTWSKWSSMLGVIWKYHTCQPVSPRIIWQTGCLKGDSWKGIHSQNIDMSISQRIPDEDLESLWEVFLFLFRQPLQCSFTTWIVLPLFTICSYHTCDFHHFAASPMFYSQLWRKLLSQKMHYWSEEKAENDTVATSGLLLENRDLVNEVQ